MIKHQPRKARRIFTDEFKQQMVNLHKAGKRKIDLIREYDLTASALDNWINQAKQGLSFNAKNNLTEQEKELLVLRKQNKQLLMEVDILKQAALIMGQKSK